MRLRRWLTRAAVTRGTRVDRRLAPLTSPAQMSEVRDIIGLIPPQSDPLRAPAGVDITGANRWSETDLLPVGALRLARNCATRSAPDTLPFGFQEKPEWRCSRRARGRSPLEQIMNIGHWRAAPDLYRLRASEISRSAAPVAWLTPRKTIAVLHQSVPHMAQLARVAVPPSCRAAPRDRRARMRLSWIASPCGRCAQRCVPDRPVFVSAILLPEALGRGPASVKVRSTEN
ncbi:hypothetical protein ACVWY3_004806 [Bradyrhizobium sp. USDA 4486]